MNKEKCRKVLFGLANSINALRSAKVGNEGFSLKMSKEFAFMLEDAIHSAFSNTDNAVLKVLEDVKAEIIGLSDKADQESKVSNSYSVRDRLRTKAQAYDDVAKLIDRKIKEIKHDQR